MFRLFLGFASTGASTMGWTLVAPLVANRSPSASPETPQTGGAADWGMKWVGVRGELILFARFAEVHLSVKHVVFDMNPRFVDSVTGAC